MNNNSNNDRQITWTEQLERFFKHSGEKALCLSSLHKQSEKVYSYRRTFIDLPVIVLSTAAGSLSIGSSSIFGEQNEKIASLGIGVLSLLVGITNTVGSYFAWGKRSETHRISQIEYAKLSRFLRLELTLPRSERMKPSELLKLVRNDWERLAEIAPMVPKKVIKEFKTRYRRRKSTICLPDELNGLDPIKVFHQLDNMENDVVDDPLAAFDAELESINGTSSPDSSDIKVIIEKKNVFNVDVEGEWEKTVQKNLNKDNNTTIT